MVTFAIILALEIIVVDVVVIIGGVEARFYISFSLSITIAVVGCFFNLVVVVVDVQLLLPLFLIYHMPLESTFPNSVLLLLWG